MPSHRHSLQGLNHLTICMAVEWRCPTTSGAACVTEIRHHLTTNQLPLVYTDADWRAYLATCLELNNLSRCKA